MISILKCNICLMFCHLKHFELPCCSYLIAAPWSKDLFILEGLCGCCSFHLYPWGSGLFCVLRKATFLFPFSPLDVRMVLGWNKTALTCEHTPKWHKGNSKVWKRPFVLLCFTFQPNQPWHQQTHHRCFHDNSLIAVRVHVHTNVIPVPLESVFIASEKRPGTQPPHTLNVLGRENKASQGKKSFFFFPLHTSVLGRGPQGDADRKWEWLLPAWASFEGSAWGTIPRRSNVPVLSPGSL